MGGRRAGEREQHGRAQAGPEGGVEAGEKRVHVLNKRMNYEG
jgi:hypothetical protein